MSRLIGFAAWAALVLGAAPSAAQTINGTLLDLETEQPIDLGLVLMFAEAGDSVGMTITDEAGRFSLSAPEPGSFLLLASALGYRETPAGPFELGEDGEMTVEYRIAPQPLAIDAIVVSLDRPVLQHALIRNGFVRRLQRGLGAFITPYDIERSPARETESLFRGSPGLSVRAVQTGPGSGPQDFLGEAVQMSSVTGMCTPTIYVDGIRVMYDPTGTSGEGHSATYGAVSLSTLVPMSIVQAVEVYRRPAEVPPEYVASRPMPQVGGTSGGRVQGECGVIVFWTKSAGAAGQRVAGTGGTAVAPGTAGPDASRTLPTVRATGPAATAGERIRMQLDPEQARQLGLGTPWEGTYLTARAGDLVANDLALGRAVAVPFDAIEVMQVERARGRSHALTRGAIAGGVFGVGMWRFLKILCRQGCDSGLGSAWVPATVTGAIVGILVGGQGPGRHWVQAPLPADAAAGEGAVRQAEPAWRGGAGRR